MKQTAVFKIFDINPQHSVVVRISLKHPAQEGNEFFQVKHIGRAQRILRHRNFDKREHPAGLQQPYYFISQGTQLGFIEGLQAKCCLLYTSRCV